MKKMVIVTVIAVAVAVIVAAVFYAKDKIAQDNFFDMLELD